MALGPSGQHIWMRRIRALSACADLRAALQVLRRAAAAHQSTAAAQKTVGGLRLVGRSGTASQCRRAQITWRRRDHAAVPPEVVAFREHGGGGRYTLCSEQSIAVVPCGAGTSLEGHIQASRGVVDVSSSTRWSPSTEDLDCGVQPGMTRKAVDSAGHTGLHPRGPGADATIGGIAACGASGTTSMSRDRVNVFRVDPVLATARSWRRAREQESRPQGDVTSCSWAARALLA